MFKEIIAISKNYAIVKIDNMIRFISAVFYAKYSNTTYCRYTKILGCITIIPENHFIIVTYFRLE